MATLNGLKKRVSKMRKKHRREVFIKKMSRRRLNGINSKPVNKGTAKSNTKTKERVKSGGLESGTNGTEVESDIRTEEETT